MKERGGGVVGPYIAIAEAYLLPEFAVHGIVRRNKGNNTQGSCLLSH